MKIFGLKRSVTTQFYLKRANKRDQALDRWAAWHELSPEDPRPLHRVGEILRVASAGSGTGEELWLKNLWCVYLTNRNDWRREILWGEIEHRLRRLERKIISTLNGRRMHPIYMCRNAIRSLPCKKNISISKD